MTSHYIYNSVIGMLILIFLLISYTLKTHKSEELKYFRVVMFMTLTLTCINIIYSIYRDFQFDWMPPILITIAPIRILLQLIATLYLLYFSRTITGLNDYSKKYWNLLIFCFMAILIMRSLMIFSIDIKHYIENIKNGMFDFTMIEYLFFQIGNKSIFLVFFIIQPIFIYQIIKLLSKRNSKITNFILMIIIASSLIDIISVLVNISKILPLNTESIKIYNSVSFVINTPIQIIGVLLLIRYFYNQEVKTRKILSDKLLPETIKIIESKLENEELISDTEFNAQKLAEICNLSHQSIIYSIKLSKYKSFNNLLSIKRIELSKKKLIDNNFDHYTLEAIADMSGFKTRENFSRKFKEIVGISPSKYKKESNMR